MIGDVHGYINLFLQDNVVKIFKFKLWNSKKVRQFNLSIALRTVQMKGFGDCPNGRMLPHGEAPRWDPNGKKYPNGALKNASLMPLVGII